MIRAVLDTNTVISGIFWRGAPRQVYSAARQQRFQLLTSLAVFDELADVLHRQKFSRFLESIDSSAEAVLREYHDMAVFVEAASDVPYPVRDTKDRIIIACAVGGAADYLISGDQDLRVLKRVGITQIQSVNEFLETLKR